MGEIYSFSPFTLNFLVFFLLRVLGIYIEHRFIVYLITFNFIHFNVNSQIQAEWFG